MLVGRALLLLIFTTFAVSIILLLIRHILSTTNHCYDAATLRVFTALLIIVLPRMILAASILLAMTIFFRGAEEHQCGDEAMHPYGNEPKEGHLHWG